MFLSNKRLKFFIIFPMAWTLAFFFPSLRADLILVPNPTNRQFVFELKTEPSAANRLLQKVRQQAKQLAQVNEISLGEAHFRRARSLVLTANQMNPTSSESLKAWEVVHHLEQAISEEYETASCHAQLGRLFFGAGNFSRAIPHLKIAAEEDPSIRSIYAQTLLASGNKEEAIAQARLARKELEQVLGETSTERSLAELSWISVLVFLEQFDEAEDWLRERQDFDYARKALAQVLVGRSAVASRISKQEGELIHERIDPLVEALQLDPENQSAIQWTVRMIHHGQSPDASELASSLEVALKEAALPPTALLVVGSSYCEIGEFELGLEFLEKASANSPARPDILNNLAYYLSKANPPRLERAFEVANQLIERFPDRLEFYETRGQIHALSENWQQARMDLERASQAMPEHPGLFQTLTLVYQKLGFFEQARKSAEHLDKLGRKSIK